MFSVVWSGSRVPPSLAGRLREAGFVVIEADGSRGGRGEPGVGGSGRVIATLLTTSARADRAPTAPRGATPWLWLPARAVSFASAAEAVRRGAYDVVALGGVETHAPDDPDAADAAASNDAVARLLARLAELAEVEAPPPEAPGLIAVSGAARAMLAQIARAAHTSMPVLITGETGTGKEEAARLIHAWSGRIGPWLPINCAAIPNELMESELFGHVRGAYSGAVASVDGKLLAAANGTVFLDEIDDTPLSTQVKLLRVLEDGEVTRVGETRGHKVDFRIVAATNRDLLGLVARNKFGADLYERLAIVHLVLPPLRQRREDIGPLAHHFIATYYARQQATAAAASAAAAGSPSARTPVRAIAASALTALEAYDWPGNVRELRNVIFQALVYKHAGDELLLSDLRRLLAPARQAGEGTSLVSADAVRERVARGAMNLRAEIERLEGIALRSALESGGGSPTRAARLLGEVGRGRSSDPGGTVRAMMKRLKIE